MKRLFLVLFLAGCTQTYTPVLLETSDLKQYQEDVNFCQTAAVKYNPSFDSTSVVVGFIQGGGRNLSTIVISPYATLIGAGGGAVAEGAESFDVFGQAQVNVFKNCLHDKTIQDHSALIANPN